MMRGFDDIVLEWDGETFSVPATSQMELIYRVESGLLNGKPGQAFSVLIAHGGPPLALLARVYAGALIYAGAKVSELEVYKAITSDVAAGDGAMLSKATSDLLGILGVLAPDDEDEQNQGKTAKKK